MVEERERGTESSNLMVRWEMLVVVLRLLEFFNNVCTRKP